MGRKYQQSRSIHKGKGIRLDVVLFGIGIILLTTYGILQYRNCKDQKNYEKTIVRLEELREYPQESKQEERTQSPYQSLFDANEDMIGWLSIPETVIDYPVMQTMEDEEYYLYRNFFGEKDRNGTLILDTDSDIHKTSNNLIIHGHNMKSGAMFSALFDYEEESFLEQHNKIYFYTEEEMREYEVLAVFRSKVYSVEDEAFKYYKFFEAESQEEFDDFYDHIKKLSEYDTGVTAQFGDEFITLSTCAYHTANGRLVVVGRRVTE